MQSPRPVYDLSYHLLMKQRTQQIWIFFIRVRGRWRVSSRRDGQTALLPSSRIRRSMVDARVVIRLPRSVLQRNMSVDTQW
jgi:hypothetical protein